MANQSIKHPMALEVKLDLYGEEFRKNLEQNSAAIKALATSVCGKDVPVNLNNQITRLLEQQRRTNRLIMVLFIVVVPFLIGLTVSRLL